MEPMTGGQIERTVNDFARAVDDSGRDYSRVYEDIRAFKQQAGTPSQLRQTMQETNKALMERGLLPDLNLDGRPDILIVGADNRGHIITANPESRTLQARDLNFNVIQEKPAVSRERDNSGTNPAGGDGQTPVRPDKPADYPGGKAPGADGHAEYPGGPEAHAPRTERWGSREFTVEADGSAQYEVKRGDTVWGVATDALRKRLGQEPTPQQIHAEVGRIAHATGLSNPNLIHPGEKLIVPPPGAEQSPAPAPGPSPENRPSPDAVKPQPPADVTPGPSQPEGRPEQNRHRDRSQWYISQEKDGKDGSQWFACGPTSLLMALADYGLATADEATRQRLIDETGTRRAGQYPGGPQLMAEHARKYGLQAEYNGSNDWRQVDAAINEGKGAIVNGSLRTRSGATIGHFVYIAGKDEQGRYIVGDPANPGQARWTAEELRAFMTRGNNPPGFASVWRA